MVFTILVCLASFQLSRHYIMCSLLVEELALLNQITRIDATFYDVQMTFAIYDRYLTANPPSFVKAGAGTVLAYLQEESECQKAPRFCQKVKSHNAH